MAKAKKRIRLIRIVAIIMILLAIASIVTGGTFIVMAINNAKEEALREKEKEQEANEQVIEEPLNYETSASLVMVGDALIHNGVYYDAYSDGVYDFNHIFNNLKSVLEKYDLRYYNQETILGGTALGLSGYPMFNSPQEVGDAFVNMGFNLVSLATNHSLDRGENGLRSSLEYWGKQENVIAAGSYETEEARTTPRIMEKNGITYTLLSYSTLTNGLTIPYGKDFLFNLYSDAKVKADVERVKDKVDVIMVAMHWGEEYTHVPTYEEKRIAQYLASLGVNIVIGTHPHVIQPIDFIGDTMVVYSLGNFISGQIGIERLVGLMASVTIKKQVADGKTTITLENPSAELVYTKKPSDYSGKRYYRLYPFSQLDDSILPGYKSYYDYFMGIATNGSKPITRIP